MSRPILASFLLLAACGEKPDDSDAPPITGEPEIHVSPESLDFGDVEVSDTSDHSLVVTIDNAGDASLTIASVSLTPADVPFEATLQGSALVASHGAVELLVRFEPTEDGEFGAILAIASDDPGTPVVELSLDGQGLAPRGSMAPSDYDFGTVPVGCTRCVDLTITNLGSLDLTLDDFQFDAASTELQIVLPLEEDRVLPPMSEVEAEACYTPTDDNPDIAYLSVTTNDPGGEALTSSVEGNGLSASMQIDSWTQDARRPLDLIAAVDKSDSMADELSWIPGIIAAFADDLSERGVDFQLALTVADDGCVRGGAPWIDPSHGRSEAESIASAMLALDEEPGLYTEAAFTLLDHALLETPSGGCNEGLQRPGAALALMGVADEAEQSAEAWSYWVPRFQALLDDPDDLVFFGLGGDYPSGCGDAAPYTGMYEAVVGTGGLFSSICAADQAANFEAIAEHVAAYDATFVLSLAPVAETLEVRVNGSATPYWRWVESQGAVIFDSSHIPEPGDAIEIEYTVDPGC